jgi:hypothetical protein
MAFPSLLVLDDAHHAGLTAAERVANRIGTNTRTRVLVPTGHTARRPTRRTRRTRRRAIKPCSTRPVDLAVLGLGRDAHVAFNEPGSGPGDGVRRIASSACAGQRRDLGVARAVLLRPLSRVWVGAPAGPRTPLRGSVHLLAEELGGLAGMARQRRAAMDAVRLPEGS